jgi:hypothetical protein
MPMKIICGLLVLRHRPPAKPAKLEGLPNGKLLTGRNLSWMDGFPAMHEPEAEYAAQKSEKTVESVPSRRNKTNR